MACRAWQDPGRIKGIVPRRKKDRSGEGLQVRDRRWFDSVQETTRGQHVHQRGLLSFRRNHRKGIRREIV